MAKGQALEVQEKKELVAKGEKTMPARYYVPHTDIYETDDALRVILEVPGVQKGQIDTERSKAEYRDGMLAVFLPQAEGDKPKRVEIR